MPKDKKIEGKSIILASDHAGFKLKEVIKNSIDKKKLETVYTEGLEQVKTTLKQTKI